MLQYFLNSIKKGVKMAFRNAIVLTGGIATGKSSVASLFLEEGFFLIDADKIAHKMLNLHQEKIANLFGAEYVDGGQVNRKKLGGLIFSNKEEKKRLEGLLHPLIYKEIEIQSIKLDGLNRPYLIDIPLFFESKGRYPIDEIIVVYTPKEIQLKRLISRDTSTPKEAQQRIDSQIDIEVKKEQATYVINNSKDFSYLQEEYVRVRDKILFNFKE